MVGIEEEEDILGFCPWLYCGFRETLERDLLGGRSGSKGDTRSVRSKGLRVRFMTLRGTGVKTIQSETVCVDFTVKEVPLKKLETRDVS